MIDVAIQQPDPGLVAFGAGQRQRHAFVEQQAIGQSGQRIPSGLQLQCLLGLDAQRDIATGVDQMALAACVLHPMHNCSQPEIISLSMPAAIQQAFRAAIFQ